MNPNNPPTPDEAFEMYRELVEGNEQAIPILLYASKEALAPVAFGGLSDGGLQPALHNVIPKLKEQFGPAKWLLMSTESWMRAEVEEDEARSARPGQLAREREAGSTEVKECVSITGIGADGTAWSYVRVFERVGGQVIWDEPHTFSGAQQGGGVPDILLHAVR